ncbi:right-handed parallel beta-helix repeat-containing protein [Gryllotalpicola koreensis]|uniref:Carbohydrate-binding protein n=1 Tax=Gryllotalpicola koreensis TaxID=993086 RepID=A0ABP8A5B0_9MICO
MLRSQRRRADGRLPRLALAAASIAAIAGAAVTVPAVASADPASGTTYFVSVHGNDSTDGRSPQHAFATIQRCADVMVAGDTCEIAGGTYRETITPTASGTSQAPITYRAAPGATVTVSGADPVTHWRHVGAADVSALATSDPYVVGSAFSQAVSAGDVYRVPIDLGDDSSPVQVFTNGAMDVEAQWPYPGADPIHPLTVERAQAGSTGATIVDPALTQPAGYWTGARVLTSYWYATETGTVIDSSPGSLTLDVAPACVHTIEPGQTRYSLAGQIAELSHDGEWYYDAAAKQLYLVSQRPPASEQIEVKQRQLGFDLTNTSNTTLRGIHLFGTSVTTGSSSTGVVLDGVVGKYLSHYTDVSQGSTDCGTTVNRGVADSGIVIKGTGNTVTNSTLSYSAGNGIALLGNGNTATQNVISDVDYAGTYAAGIAVQGYGETVLHNTISKVGRSGINLQWITPPAGTQAPDHIAYNDISQYGNLNLDVAAIYACCGSAMQGTSVDHNVLHDATPAIGTTNTFAMAGVYADNGQSDLRIIDNVGWNNPTQTVMLNGLGSGSYNNLVANNTGGVYMMYVKAANQSTGTVVENNIGPMVGTTDATQGGMVLTDNLDSTTVDPKFTDPANNIYTLQADSPARNAAIPLPGVNDGSTDPIPSLGAYQYGAPVWTAGAAH